MRSLAIELGYKLNEYGLFKNYKGRLVKIKISSEKDIFKKLGMEFIEPKGR
jgi:DNA polymerase/3'-5' exonuclease PolX